MSSSQFAVTLEPNGWEARAKPFALAEREWRLAVAIVEKHGCRANTFTGLSKRDVHPFRDALRRGVEQESLSDGDRRVLDGLLGFLDGAGVGGFGLSRGFKSWRG